MLFKDLSEVHNYSIKVGDPDLFDQIVKPAIEKARKQVSLSSSYIGNVDDNNVHWWEALGAERLVDMGEPEDPTYLVRNFVEEAQPTYIYGGRGSLKSIDAVALGLGIASAEVNSVLGYPVEHHGPVIVYDSEMSSKKFNLRAKEICAGFGINIPPDIYYKNVVGLPPSEAFPDLHELATKIGAVAVIVDSWGFATRGSPEDYDAVRNETAEYLNPLIAKGIATIIVEHKPHQGNHLFGSVIKEYHGRYIFRVEDLDGDDREKGIRNTRLINEKASFGDEGQKTTLVTRFEPGKITIENTETVEEDFIDTSAPAKVTLALESRDKTKPELADATDYAETYLATLLPKMVKGKTPPHRIYHVGNKGREYLYSLDDPSGGRTLLSSTMPIEGNDNNVRHTPPSEAKDQLSSTSTFHRESDVDDGSDSGDTVVDQFPQTGPEQTLSLKTPNPLDTSDELSILIKTLEPAEQVALDLETMPPEGWVWEVVGDYRQWRKKLKNKPKPERMRAQWDTFKEKVYKKYAVNSETAQIRLVSLATEEGLNEIVDASHVDIAPLLKILKHKTLIAHNGSFDLGVLRERYDYVHEGPVLDTQLLYILHHYAQDGDRSVIRDGKWRLPDPTKTKVDIDDSGPPKVGMTSLKAVVRKYLPDVELDKAQQSQDWSVPDLPSSMVAYSLKDSRVLLDLAAVLQGCLESIGMADIVENVESRAFPSKVWMERTGIPANRSVAKNMGSKYAAEAEKALQKLTGLLEGVDAPNEEAWSWTKPDHVRAALEALGANLDELTKTGKTGAASTGKDSLNKISGPPVALEWVKAYLQYQNLRKRSSDFVDKYAELVRENGTIPGRFDTVSTGRYNCIKPNLQQVPKRGELQTLEGMRIRDIFRAREGESLIIADFAQVELLLAATIAERRSGTRSKMLEVFRTKDSDIHRATAAWVLGKPENDITEAQRTLAKAINFGLIYGCSADKLLEVAVNDYGIRDMKLKDARKYRKAFFDKYPEFVAWHEKVSKECGTGRGYATTPRGRRRKLPKWDKSGEVAFTTAVNHPVQGAGADAIKLTLAKLFEDRHNCPGNPELNCTVHDEVILSVKTDHAEAAKAWVEKHMADAEREAVMDQESPIAVDVEVKQSWGGG
jgi:DNA polymerase I-like protein with 3'-5' exonuclease and polymerase domains